MDQIAAKAEAGQHGSPKTSRQRLGLRRPSMCLDPALSPATARYRSPATPGHPGIQPNHRGLAAPKGCIDARFDYTDYMPKQLLDEARVNRQAFEVTTFLEAEQTDLQYWRSRSPDERLAALELSRQIAYGYDPTARRLSRFFEVVEFPPR